MSTRTEKTKSQQAIDNLLKLIDGLGVESSSNSGKLIPNSKNKHKGRGKHKGKRRSKR
jgi:hypothetical protein